MNEKKKNSNNKNISSGSSGKRKKVGQMWARQRERAQRGSVRASFKYRARRHYEEITRTPRVCHARVRLYENVQESQHLIVSALYGCVYRFFEVLWSEPNRLFFHILFLSLSIELFLHL